MATYREGTIAVTNGSKTVTGTNTLWQTYGIQQGDQLYIANANGLQDGYLYEVASVTDNTHLTLWQNYQGSTASGKAYAILNTAGNQTLPAVAARLANFMSELNGVPSETAKGLVKLYSALGTNTDGALTQAAAKTAIDGKVSIAQGASNAGRPLIVNSSGNIEAGNSWDYDSGEQKNSVFDPQCTNLGTISSPSDIATFLADNHVTTGKFGNLKLNNCITIAGSSLSDGNADWLIAGFNFYYNVGSENIITKPHLALIPKTKLGEAAMNSTNTTVGGYAGSDMHTTVMAAEATRLNHVLGSYLLSCDRMLTRAVSTSLYNRFGSAGGASSGSTWTNTKCELMTEANLFGAQPCSSSGYDTGEGCRQLPIFHFITHNRYERSNFWLRAVASSAYFAVASGHGYSDSRSASSSLAVRPLIFVG